MLQKTKTKKKGFGRKGSVYHLLIAADTAVGHVQAFLVLFVGFTAL